MPECAHTSRHNDCLNICHCNLIGEWMTTKCIHFIFTPALIHQKHTVGRIIRRSICQREYQSKVSNNRWIDWGALIVFVYLKYYSWDCSIPQIPWVCSQGERQWSEWLEVIGFHDDQSHILNADVKYKWSHWLGEAVQTVLCIASAGARGAHSFVSVPGFVFLLKNY